MHGENLGKNGGQTTDISLWGMCIGGGVVIVTSNLHHFFSGSFSFHVSYFSFR